MQPNNPQGAQPQKFLQLPNGQLVPAQQQMLQQPAIHNTNINIQGADGKPMPMIVQARDCVDQSALHQNISTNLRLFKNRVVSCEPVKDKVLIVSAGPSTLKNLELIREEKQKGTVIVCVKHSLPMLMQNGIIPDACVILDPREVEGISTHNIKRSTLFDNISSETVFLVASMTHPSVTKLLLEKGARIIGWDAMVANITEYFKFDVPFAIIGGSCSAIRALSLFRLLGVTDFSLVGFDCEFSEAPKDVTAKLPDGRPKYITVDMLGKKRITTGELVALVQDFERLLASPILDFKVEVLGEGMVKDLFDQTFKKKPTFRDVFTKTEASLELKEIS